MPVTRIKNNQITDASAGNIYLGVNAASKLQDFSITSAKIANDLTYNSSLTITGNLTVQGNTTQIDTVNLIVEDPLILLAKEQTGSPALDIGYIGKRGTEDNIAFVWDESNSAFITAFTTSETTNTTITITSYANLITNVLEAAALDVTGNITAANLDVTFGITAGTTITATGNITGGNLTTAGITDTGSLTASTTIDATGNITGGNLTTAGITDTGSLTASTTIDATGNITGGNLTTAGITDTGSLTASTTIDATGNITGGNLTTAGITDTGSLTASTTIDATGNITGGNLTTTGIANIGNLEVTGTTSLTGNVISPLNVTGNITANIITATEGFFGNLTLEDLFVGNITANGFATITGNVTGGNLITSNLVSAGSLETTGNALIGGNLIVQGNITYINIDDLRVEDPIIILGTGPNGAPLTVDDGKDRGVYMEYYTTGLGNAFIGFDNSTGNMVIANDVSFSANDVVQVNAYGTLEVGNIYAQSGTITGTLDVTGNITGGNLTTAGITDTGSLTASTTIDATGNITGGNLTTAGITDTGSLTASTTIDATGNITGGNLNTAGQVVATGNITGGNITTAGNISSTADINANNAVITNNVSANIFSATYAVYSPLVSTLTGNLDITSASGADIVINAGGGTGNINLPAKNANTVLYVDADKNIKSTTNLSYDGTNANLQNGNFTIANVVIGFNDIETLAGNLNIGSATGENIVIDAGGGSGNINLPAKVANTVLFVNADNNMKSSANFTYDGTNANLQNGTLRVDNVLISSSDVTSTNGILTINVAGADVDFVVNGDTVSNIFYVDAGTGTASFGNSTQIAEAIVAFNTTDSILVPTGTNAERPAVGVTGMLRFNTSLDQLEFYDADSWTPAGTVFTIVTADSFNGDGSTTAYTLSDESTTASTIVSINGVVQIPVTAYSVSGNVLTFTEAPAVSDVVDARILVTTQTVKAIVNTTGNASVEVSDLTNDVSITGDLVPVANISGNLGSPTLQWQDLYLSGNSIFLGDIVIKDVGANQIGFFRADGTTPATIDSNNVDTTQIANGTSSLAVIASGGNIRANIGGSTITTISSSGMAVTGALSATTTVTATGNVTGGNLVTTGNVVAGNLQVSGIEAVTTLNVSGDTTIVGNLTVSGTTITANVSSLVVTDPILGLGRGANGNPLTTNDGLDRGVEMFYYTTAERIAFMGFDNSAGKMLSAANVSIANNIVTVNNFGTTTVGTLETSGIVNTNANGVGNIGSATTFFNTVFAKATSAQYADLAEMYEADAQYEPGTVLCFGGTKEATLCSQADSTRVAGVVSTNPSYLMNSGQTGDNVVAVALTGRVPCKVTGIVRKGDLMVSTGDGRARANNDAQVGSVIGKALADFDGTEGVIEVVVGRV